MSVLPIGMYVYHMLQQGQRRCLIPWDWSYGLLRATMGLPGSKPDALPEKAVLLTPEKSFQS